MYQLLLLSSLPDDCSRPSLPALDVCVTSDDKRYFVSETDDISNLEASVLESPRDTQLWIKLAFKYLSQKETYVGRRPLSPRCSGPREADLCSFAGLQPSVWKLP